MTPTANTLSSVRRRLATHPTALAAVALTLALAACGGGDTPPPPAADGGSASAPPVAPISSRDGAPPPAAQTAGAAQAGTLAWDLPEGWQEVAPSSSMRLAQAVIPGEAGPAELVVFYFGPGGGGGVEANIDRWIGQMEVAPGTEPQRDRFTNDAGLVITWVDVEGTILPSGMGMGPTSPQPGSRMLAAVIEGPGGPWFFKATGPADTLDAQREAFLGLLRNASVG